MSDKSRRNAELVIYPEQLAKALEVLESGYVKNWAWILHDKDKLTDGSPKAPHIHLMCAWAKPTKDSVIANRFGIRSNQIENIKGTWADALDYLTHANAPTKYQYDESEVHSNFDWAEAAKESNSRANARIKALIERIGTGEVREYNLTEYISVEDYVKHKRQIDHAFAWRRSYVHGHLEELVEMKNIVWIYGQTGTGKTTLAKSLAKSARLVAAITSTGRNMFDEYRDEPCLIIDDLRPDDMKFSDLLGVLDPYNFKAAQARYQNKALQTQMVIVTTTLSPEEFCRRCNGDGLSAEDARQLFRRLNTVCELTKDEMLTYEYEVDEGGAYSRSLDERMPNVWLIAARNKQKSSNKSLFAAAAESAMGLA